MIDSIVIFDIDGVLADCQHRRHFIEQEPPDWNAFYAACVADPLIERGAILLRMLWNAGQHIVFYSGRSESVRQDTSDWLARYGLAWANAARLVDKLWMRPVGDHRPDYVLKVEVVEKLPEWFGLPISLVVDDSLAVVDALVARGFTCLHFRWPGEDANRAMARRHNEKLAEGAAT